MLERLLNERQMSVYQCAKLSGIPYTTLLEIVRGKTDVVNRDNVDDVIAAVMKKK